MRFVKFTLFLVMLILLCSSCNKPKKLHDVWDVVDFNKEDITRVEDTRVNVTKEEKEHSIQSFLNIINVLKLDKKLDRAPEKFSKENEIKVATTDNKIFIFSFNLDNLKITDDKGNESWFALKHKEINEQMMSEVREKNKWQNLDATIINKLKFSAGDIEKVSITYSDLSQDNSIIESMRRLQSIELLKRLKKSPDVGNVYDEFNIELFGGKKYKFQVYDDYLKMINKEGKKIWYQIKSHAYNRDLLMKKPVIYLYPEKTTEVSVKLDLAGDLTYTYPTYQNGWNVIANPDGVIKDKADGNTYSYLFWEGVSNAEFDLSKGFVVKGSDTTEFLQEKLSYLGLNRKEANEFIVYWAPKMSENPYNLITFQDKAYTELAKLTITPKPDSMLRVYMVYKPLEKNMEIPEQKLMPWDRKGFAVVEWGGTDLQY